MRSRVDLEMPKAAKAIKHEMLSVFYSNRAAVATKMSQFAVYIRLILPLMPAILLGR